MLEPGIANCAPTCLSASIVNSQSEAQASDQPMKTDAFELSESVTLLPLAKVAEHVPGQSIPVGVDVTRPVPLPPTLTVSVTGRFAEQVPPTLSPTSSLENL